MVIPSINFFSLQISDIASRILPPISTDARCVSYIIVADLYCDGPLDALMLENVATSNHRNHFAVTLNAGNQY